LVAVASCFLRIGSLSCPSLVGIHIEIVDEWKRIPAQTWHRDHAKHRECRAGIITTVNAWGDW
jgi:hypothetical protein